MEQEKKELNPEIDTTKFVNIDKDPYDIYINGKLARHLNADEEAIVPLYVAQIGAKHLVDRILQERHNIKDTNRDDELRRSLFAKILPEMAEERAIKPLTDEEYRAKVDERLEAQDKVIKDLQGKADKTEEKDEIAKLKKELQMLKMRGAKKDKKDETVASSDKD